MIEREAGGSGTSGGEHTWIVILADTTEGVSRALAQARRVGPPERTVVVITARRPIGLGARALDRAHVLVEPLDRGSAASVLFAIYWLLARDRGAVAVISTRDRGALGARLGGAIRYAERRPDHVALVGESHPSGRDGARLIVPGDRIDTADDTRAYHVRALVEPGDGGVPARALRDAGVVVGSAAAIVDAAARNCASLVDRLARAGAFSGQEHERWALRQAYALAEPAGLFTSLLAGALSSLAVIEIGPARAPATESPVRSQAGRARLELAAPASRMPATSPHAAALSA